MSIRNSTRLNFNATNVGSQGGMQEPHGDEAADPANGTSKRASHACVTIPSTIGGINPGVPRPPPTVICVPLAGGMSDGC